jgi:hypothetical protein
MLPGGKPSSLAVPCKVVEAGKITCVVWARGIWICIHNLRSFHTPK